MKIALSQQYENADGTPAVDAATKKPIILKDILLQVCLHEGARPDEKVKRWNLYRTIKKSQVPFAQLDVEEIAFLKRAITETHSVLVVGQTHEMLEHEYEPPIVGALQPPPAPIVPKTYPKRSREEFDPDDYRQMSE
jgi:hypothetical protein